MNEALQTAIYSSLTGDATLMGIVTGVYDGAPQSGNSQDPSLMPYVTLGDDVIAPWSTDDWSGGEAIVSIHVWSRYQGRREAKQILDRIRVVLDRQPLSVTGYTAVTVDFESSFVELDPDGETRHGVIDFRVLLCT